MYNYKCEYCEGTVKEKVVRQEAFKHKDGFVILEKVPIGVCDLCGYRYYNSSLLHKVNDIALNKIQAERSQSVPVVSY